MIKNQTIKKDNFFDYRMIHILIKMFRKTLNYNINFSVFTAIMLFFPMTLLSFEFIDDKTTYIENVDLSISKSAENIIADSMIFWNNRAEYRSIGNTFDQIRNDENIEFVVRVEISNSNEESYNTIWVIFTNKNNYLISKGIVNSGLKIDQISVSKTKTELFCLDLLENNIMNLKTNTENIYTKDPNVYFVSVFYKDKVNQFAIIQPIFDHNESYTWQKPIIKNTINHINILDSVYEFHQQFSK